MIKVVLVNLPHQIICSELDAKIAVRNKGMQHTKLNTNQWQPL